MGIVIGVVLWLLGAHLANDTYSREMGNGALAPVAVHRVALLFWPLVELAEVVSALYTNLIKKE